MFFVCSLGLALGYGLGRALTLGLSGLGLGVICMNCLFHLVLERSNINWHSTAKIKTEMSLYLEVISLIRKKR